MAGAGVLVLRKDFAVVAELIHEIITNEGLRARLIEVQHTRVRELELGIIRTQFRACLEKVAA